MHKWCVTLILASGRQRQVDLSVLGSQCYTVRLSLKKQSLESNLREDKGTIWRGFILKQAVGLWMGTKTGKGAEEKGSVGN